jgi:hypothetical protein
MDCMQAQTIVSAGLDREPVDAQELTEAKEHCRGCEQCTAFVKSLAAMQRSTPPAPPEGLAHAVATTAIARVAAERIEADRASGAGAEAPSIPMAERVRAMSPVTLAAWAGAAALILVVFGVAAWTGVRTILVPSDPAILSESRSSGPAPQAPAATEGSVSNGGTQAADSFGSATAGKSADALKYITVNGSVYEETRESNASTSTMQTAAQTTSSLGGAAVASRTVWRRSIGRTVFVENEEGALLEFTPVTRQFRGRSYSLRSNPITAYGAWPTLPSDIPPPTDLDGSPTFRKIETAGGVDVYSRIGATISSGIAIGPGTGGSDPAAGNPGWTWWEP